MAIICLFISCAENNYKQIVSSFRASAYHGLDRYYVAIPINVGNTEKGIIVCRGFLLYNLLYKDIYREQDFSNYLFASLVKEEILILTERQYDSIKNYTISKADADKYQKMKLHNLLRLYSNNHFLPGIRSDIPNYQGRCVIYGFLKEGIPISIEDETGFLAIHK